MLQAVTNDRERQEDEVTALSSIYDETEFFYTKGEKIKCTVNISLNFPRKLKVRLINNLFDATSVIPHDEIFVEHLPPIKLYIQLPDTYPSRRSPNFWLSISWLPPWEISYICQKLDEMWQEHKGNEILFLWVDFLHNDILDFLGVQESLDVSFMCMVHWAPNDYIESCLASLSDSRAINGALFLNPAKLLVSYNEAQHKVWFQKNSYMCLICLEEHIGLGCIELRNCGHVYCKSCMQQHICTKINEHINFILCPTLGCNCKIDANDVKTLCPSLFQRYEELVLRVTLDTMYDVIYCPRPSCQYPVIKDADDIAATCPTCYYCFCVYCRKIYHGIAPCEMASSDVEKLIKDYKNSDPKRKKLLEKKHGKRQIQLIENRLTAEYLKENAKSCPNCRSFISKVDGCNKITCSHCQSYFCWLCGEKITSINAYEHFTRSNSSCFGRLFEGAKDFDFDYDVVQNIIHFEPDVYLD